jgi:hypothetical protein
MISCVTREKCNKYYPAQTLKSDSVTVKVFEKVIDTVIEVVADSSWLKAWIECDSMGQATIKELIDYQNGKRTNLPRVRLQNNILTTDCKCDSVKIHALLKNREISIDNRSNVTITPPPVAVKYIPGWMWFFGGTGMATWGFIACYLIIIFVKRKFRI